ncbi:UrcA family protein [Sphingopyxis panaciterrae]|uniref:UrcA family protein n=1 Tax=Sphingopyxis panaciterrae TaxID=363841 RepID=UPI0014202382|nr:UrcA family protein [Sphingopyxis panaciterrae]NIJ36024.1 UrcA family protein [Sphingopyxis panaciterrae]
MIIRTTIIAVSLAYSAPAFAAPADDGISQIVRIDDLNLAVARDRETLEARVERAARRLCRSDLRGTTELALQTECIAAAHASAKPQADRAVAAADRGMRIAAR